MAHKVRRVDERFFFSRLSFFGRQRYSVIAAFVETLDA